MRTRLAALLILSLANSACTGTLLVRPVAPVQPSVGFLFANQRAPLMTDLDATTLGSKHGVTQTYFVMDPLLTRLSVALGDASIERAARESGIRTVRHADYELLNVLGIFMRFRVHVYGD